MKKLFLLCFSLLLICNLAYAGAFSLYGINLSGKANDWFLSILTQANDTNEAMQITTDKTQHLNAPWKVVLTSNFDSHTDLASYNMMINGIMKNKRLAYPYLSFKDKANRETRVMYQGKVTKDAYDLLGMLKTQFEQSNVKVLLVKPAVKPVKK
jgi:hypothetical protein